MQVQCVPDVTTASGVLVCVSVCECEYVCENVSMYVSV